MKAFPIVIALAGVVACAQLKTLNPAAESDWDRAMSYSRQKVDAGNYFAAEKIINEYIRTHPDTREAREIAFWKAAYTLDPANDRGSLAGGIAALDGYLSANTDGWYRNEATVLRRTAAVAQGVLSPPRTATGDSSVSTVVRDTVVVVSKSREEQIATLKDQLAKTREELSKVSAELERIKKRLASPSK